jgi:hypothetical protein
MPPLRALVLAGLIGPLVACSQGAPDKPAPDPLIAAALAAPLMTDPDLATLNRAGVALSGSGVPSALIPTEDLSQEAKSAALAEATGLAGGSLKPAPSPTGSAGAAAKETVLLTWKASFDRQDCAAKASHTAMWAAKMPAELPVFPRGHVQEAAGSDEAGCQLRAVNFRTPVPAEDVLAFYYTRAAAAGIRSEHRATEDAHLLKGGKAALAFAVHVRPGPDGLTEVDLLTAN